MGTTKSEEFTVKDNKIAAYAKALAHPARIAILKILIKKQACICGDIVDELPLSQSTVSQHLKELKETGLKIFKVLAVIVLAVAFFVSKLSDVISPGLDRLFILGIANVPKTAVVPKIKLVDNVFTVKLEISKNLPTKFPVEITDVLKVLAVILLVTSCAAEINCIFHEPPKSS